MVALMFGKVDLDQRVTGGVGRTGQNRAGRPNGTEPGAGLIIAIDGGGQNQLQEALMPSVRELLVLERRLTQRTARQ